jgi:hypothetical protein
VNCGEFDPVPRVLGVVGKALLRLLFVTKQHKAINAQTFKMAGDLSAGLDA